MFKTTKRHTPAPAAAPLLERLEDRALLSGNVVGAVANGTLTLTGDAGDNDIVIDQAGLSSQQFRVTGSGTTVNGAPSAIFNVVSKDVKIDLKGGNDTVVFNSVALPGDLTVKGGDGDNAVSLQASTVARHVTVRNGVGADSFTMAGGSRVDRNVTIINGSGGSNTLLDDSVILWDLNLRAAGGSDSLTMAHESLVNRHLRASYGADGSSTVVDDSGITGRLTINASGALDTVDVVNGSTISRGAGISSRGTLVFVADDARFDDNLFVRAAGDLHATIANGCYFAFVTSLTGGSTTPSTVTIADATLNGRFSLRTGGGSDSVTIEDSTFNQSASIATGPGNDVLAIEQSGANPGPVTTFNGRFTFSAGSGDDTVALGINGNAGNQVIFGSKANFSGGPGLDTHALPENAVYALPPVFASF